MIPKVQIRVWYVLIFAFVVVWCPIVASAQAEFPSTDAFVKSVVKEKSDVSVEAKGDLNGDGLADWAGVVRREKGDFQSTYQLYVLLQLTGGSYRVAETSTEAEIPGMGCCWVEDLRIARSSIFVQNNAKTAATMEAATHQFKLQRGQWRLIGVRIYYIDHSTDISTDTDVNLLTGLVIEKKQKGERRPTTTRRTKKFALRLLKDFDFLNGFGIDELGALPYESMPQRSTNRTQKVL
jgi:hypothetical protein